MLVVTILSLILHGRDAMTIRLERVNRHEHVEFRVSVVKEFSHGSRENRLSVANVPNRPNCHVRLSHLHVLYLSSGSSGC